MGSYAPPTDYLGMLEELSAFQPVQAAPAKPSFRQRAEQGFRELIERPVRTGRLPAGSPLGRATTDLSDKVGQTSALLDELGQGVQLINQAPAHAIDWLVSDQGQPAAAPAPGPGGAAPAPRAGGLAVGSPEWRERFPDSAARIDAAADDGTHGIRPEDFEFERRLQSEGDEAARRQVLAGGFRATSDPWNSVEQGAAQMMIDMGARDLLNARDQQARAAIDATANDAARRTLEGHQMNAAIEELLPTERPTLTSGGTQGAFDQRPDGTFVNAPPQMRLGPARSIVEGTRVQQSVMAIQQGLTQLETRLAQEVREGKRTQQDADEAYQRAERRAGMLMQGIMGGKSDFSGFFKKGNSLEELLLASAAAQQPAPAR